jgi:phosphoribosyl-AMP cyclohydrolase
MNELEEGTRAQLDFGKLRKHADSGDVLFVGYANRLALAETLRLRQAVLWSTSRNELWHKGKTSGDWLDLVDVRVNCEQNSLLYRVRPRSGACHTKDASGKTRPLCYYRELVDEATLQPTRSAR